MTTVARAIAQRLRVAGVRYVFGHPGGEVVDLIDGFASEGLEFVLTRHEATAGFMADAVGAFGDAPGVCLGTLGPGATNLVTGVAQSFLDRSPVIAISGQLPADRYDVVTHQRLDLRALFAPITKWQAHVTAANAVTVTDRAIRVSMRQRRGPVYLEIPSDVPAQEAASGGPHDEPETSAATVFPEAAGNEAARILRESERPVILAGMDAMDTAAVSELRALADEWAIPVMVGPKAKGVFREDHPLFLGTIEALGTGRLFDYVAECDLVLMIGFEPVEFDRDWTAKAKIIHIGPLPNDDLYFRAAAELVGPTSGGIQALRNAAAPPSPKHRMKDIAAARRSFVSFVQPETAGLAAQSVLRELRAVLPEDALVSCDVGQNKSVAGQCWPAYEPKTFFVSNGLSSMGYGFAAAMGLQLLDPRRRVACILGDGGFAMYLGELETAVRRELPIIVVVLADHALTQIKLGQERKGFGATGTTFGAIDYVTLARAFGAEGAEIRRVEDCREVFKWALERRGPTVIAAYIDPDCYRLR